MQSPVDNTSGGEKGGDGGIPGGEGLSGGAGGGFESTVKREQKWNDAKFCCQFETRLISRRSSFGLPVLVPAYTQLSVCCMDRASTPSASPGGSAE
eukprot:4488659-Prymnesium_polylepis.3